MAKTGNVVRGRFARLVLSGVMLAAATALVEPSLAHAEIWKVNETCPGSAAERCGWINFDTVNKRVRGYATIEDIPTDNLGYEVAVNTLRLLKNGVEVSKVSDFDGWHDGKRAKGTHDTAHTGLISCKPRDVIVFMFESKWKGASTGSDHVVVNSMLC